MNTLRRETGAKWHGGDNGARFRRVRQFAHVLAFRVRPDRKVDAELRRLLADERQWQLLARLAPFDRAHQLRVHAILVTKGHSAPDLLCAALLHDVGKADERGHVGLPERVAHVLLRECAPKLLERLSARRRRGPLGSLWLARHHAQLGARLAAVAGASVRCCELIARHEGPSDGDRVLASLIAADSRAVT